MDVFGIALLGTTINKIPKSLISAFLALVSFSSSVEAADVAVPTYKTETAFSWTGLYFGVHGGDTLGILPLPSEHPGDPKETHFNGGFGGIQAGYNYQFAQNWMLGVEQDISLGDITGRSVDPRLFTVTNTENYSGTIRARFGYVANSILVYETVGVAFAHDKVLLAFPNATVQAAAGASQLNYADDHVFVGVAAGVGTELVLARNATMKVEYLYTGFQPRQYFAATDQGMMIGTHTHSVRVGLNWLFH